MTGRPARAGKGPFAAVDPASLAVFRAAFGAILCWEIAGMLVSGEVQRTYGDPDFRFTYYGFGWVRPLPGWGLQAHFAVVAAAAASLAIGFWTRTSAVVFTLGFAWIFLLEKARYLNHFYLILILGGLLAVVPAGRALSIDSLRKGARAVPAWSVFLVRTQIGLVYLHAGIAKLNGDWLRAEPLRTWLARRSERAIYGPFLETEAAAYLFSYGGLLLDLLAWPLLVCRATRLPTFAIVAAFHFTNATLFNIGVFPWLAIAASTIFFEPDWPRRLLRRRPFELSTTGFRPGLLARAGLCVVGAHLAFQALFPLRHFLYPGEVSWNEEGHRFAWHMKLRGKSSDVAFRATDPDTGEIWLIDPEEHLEDWQYRKMAGRPDMLIQYAHHIARDLRAKGHPRIEVRATTKVSLNGRPPEPLVDPEVDLAAERRGFHPYRWLLPLKTPLRPN